MSVGGVMPKEDQFWKDWGPEGHPDEKITSLGRLTGECLVVKITAKLGS
jgi:hypothetical protein